MLFGLFGGNAKAPQLPQYPTISVPSFEDDKYLLGLEKKMPVPRYRGLDAGKTFIPFSLEIDKKLSPKRADDFSESIVRHAARIGFHILFTLPTFVFQAAYGLCKRGYAEYTFASHAKKILNIIRCQGYSPKFIEHVQKQAGINVMIAAKDRGSFMEKIRELANWKPRMDKVMQEEIGKIAVNLKKEYAKSPEKAKESFDLTVSSFLSTKGFDDVPREERLKCAKDVAKGIVEKLVVEDAEEVIGNLEDTHQIVGFKAKLDKMAKQVKEIAGISTDEAQGIVAQVAKKVIEEKYPSVKAFEDVVIGLQKEHVTEIFKGESVRLEVLIRGLEMRFSELSHELREAYLRKKQDGARETADQIRRIIKEDLETLNKKLVSLTATIDRANDDKKILAMGGHRRGGKYAFSEITQTKHELIGTIEQATQESDRITKAINEKNDLLRRLNRGESIDLNAETIKTLEAESKKVLELVRENKERLKNLDKLNERELRIFSELMSQISKTSSCLNKGRALEAVTKKIADETQKFDSLQDKMKRVIGYGPKITHISTYDTMESAFHIFGADSEEARNALKIAYEAMQPSQKAAFAQKVAEAVGISRKWFESYHQAQANFGKRYIKAYLVHKAGFTDGVRKIAIDPKVIHKVIQSDTGKNAAKVSHLPLVHKLRQRQWKNFAATAA